MKKLLLILSLLLIPGCSLFQTHQSSMIEPKLLKQSALPPIQTQMMNHSIEILCEFLLREDGTVEQAKILRTSGDKTWDFLAEASLLKWEFSPALLDGQPIKILIKRQVKVVFADPVTIPLAEMQFNTLAEAESVYYNLKRGMDFGELAGAHSVSASKQAGGVLGEVDIQYYSSEIRRILFNLNEEEFTNPIAYGDHYIIFKRLK